MKKRLRLCAALLFVFLTFGCLFPAPDYKTTNYYSFGEPENVVIPASRINVGLFNNVACSSQRMVYRKDYKILIDSYDKWAQSPDFMVKSYLEEALEAKGSKAYELSGSLFVFEIDLIKREAVLGVRYSISEKEQVLLEQKSVFKSKYNKTEGAGFACAMTKNLHSLAREIAEKLKSLQQKQKTREKLDKSGK